MNQCIKCGVPIADGELFCPECSLNPAASLFDEVHGEGHPLPPGKMQTPVPVKRQPVKQSAQTSAKKKKRPALGLAIALTVVSLLLLSSLGYQLWQYGDMLAKQNRIRVKEADLSLRESEIDELQLQLEQTALELEKVQALAEEKEAEIQDLAARLAASQSSQSQGEYDLTAKEQELERMEEENLQLLALTDDLQLKIDGLRKTISDLETENKTLDAKATFLDTYVVFVESDGTDYYHTYDCKNFAKYSFWAYSRKLAEAQGYTACPICKGMP